MRSFGRTIAAAVLLSMVLAACGRGDETSDEQETPAPAATETASEGATYLPVPDEVQLTEPGAELALEEPAVVAWEPRQGLVGVVEVAVMKIERTTIKKAFANYNLDDAAKESTPYFVRLAAINAGETDLGARRLPVYAITSNGTLVEPSGIAQTFKPCPRSLLPAVYAPGDQANTCLVFLLPKGTPLDSVVFRPADGVVPLTWTGKVNKYPPKPKKDKKKSKKSGSAQKDDEPDGAS